MTAARAHVLVARLDNDGDVLLAGPAVRAVAAGAGRVTFLCGPRGRGAAALLPGVDALLVHRASWIDPEPEPVDPPALQAFVATLADLRLDQAIVLTSRHQSALPLALLLRLAGVPTVAAVSDEYAGSLLDVRHRVPVEIHEVERALSLVRTLGYVLPPGDDGALRVRRDLAARTPPLDEEPYVVVHPGASVPSRSWPPDSHRALVEALVARGRRVVVTGSPAERALTAHVAGPPRPGVVDAGGATDLAGLAEVLAGAQAVIVGNTGPAHLAAAVGTPVVSIFAATISSTRWRPWGVPLELLELAVPCAGCRTRVCPVPGHPCVSDIRVADVLAAVERLAPAPVAVPAGGRGGDASRERDLSLPLGRIAT